MLLTGSILVILFVMFFVGAEVLMRYAFDTPIPGHLEALRAAGADHRVPGVVLHPGDAWPRRHGPRARFPVARERAATREMATLLISIFICSVLAFFSFKNAYQLWLFDDVTMSPPYFKTWPSGAAIPLGYTLVSIRMYIQFLHLYDPDRFPANEPTAGGFHAVE